MASFNADSNRTDGQFIFIDDDPVNNIICQMTIEMILGKVPVQSFTEPSVDVGGYFTKPLSKDTVNKIFNTRIGSDNSTLAFQ